MSTDQVVSRYPPEWIEALCLVDGHYLSCGVRDDRCYACGLIRGGAENRLAALEEVGALAMEGEEWACRRPDGRIEDGYGGLGSRRAARAAGATIVKRRVGPWVEVPE